MKLVLIGLFMSVVASAADPVAIPVEAGQVLTSSAFQKVVSKVNQAAQNRYMVTKLNSVQVVADPLNAHLPITRVIIPVSARYTFNPQYLSFDTITAQVVLAEDGTMYVTKVESVKFPEEEE